MNIKQATDTLAQIARLRDDTLWQQRITGYEHRGIRDYERIIYMMEEPTQTLIDVCYQNAPTHNSKSHRIEFLDDFGLYKINLFCCLDSSD